MLSFLLLNHVVFSAANYPQSMVLDGRPAPNLGSCGRTKSPPLGSPEWDILDALECSSINVSYKKRPIAWISLLMNTVYILCVFVYAEKQRTTVAAVLSRKLPLHLRSQHTSATIANQRDNYPN